MLNNQPDIWTELKELRDMVVAQRVELGNMQARLTASESHVDELNGEVVDHRVELSVTKNEVQFHENKVEKLETRNVGKVMYNQQQ
jgi:uncharacterized coiled-coil protein SlyX